MTRDNANATLGSHACDERAYILYKEQWIREHVSTEVLLQTMRDYSAYTDECVLNEEEFLSYDEWLQENGFSGTGGSVYACFEEFVDNEYENGHVVKDLLSEADFKVWCNEREYNPADFKGTEQSNTPYREVAIDTCSGRLLAWVDEGVYGPQAGVIWLPDNESPIDLFYAENRRYDKNNVPVETHEIHCYTYEDITTEDWTGYFKFTQEEALEALY